MACSQETHWAHLFDSENVEDISESSGNWVPYTTQPCPFRHDPLNRQVNSDSRYHLPDEQNFRQLSNKVSLAGLFSGLLSTPGSRTSTPAVAHPEIPPSPIEPPYEEEDTVTQPPALAEDVNMSSEPSGSGGNPPVSNNPSALLQALLQSQQTLVQSMAQLNHAVTALAEMQLQSANNGSSSLDISKLRSVQKPATFNGTRGADARRFIAAFTIWAESLGREMQEKDASGNWVLCHSKFIRSAMSFLTDDAAIWATPHMESIANQVIPFDNDWRKFVVAFKLRFESVDESVDAKEALRALWQGRLTVAEYAAKFKEHAGRTGYSEADLHDRFYEHLSTEVKDALVHTEKPIATLADLEKVAVQVDYRIRQRKAEKAREQGRSTTAPKVHAPVPSMPHISPFVAKDPNAMDIDATRLDRKGPNGRTVQEFLTAMNGKCFGCGSTAHTKVNGNHDRDLCGWCRRIGHREGVCQSKWMGHPKTAYQKAAVVSTEKAKEAGRVSSPNSFAVLSEEPQAGVSVSGTRTAGAAVAATSGTAQNDFFENLLRQQKEFAEQLAALQKAF